MASLRCGAHGVNHEHGWNRGCAEMNRVVTVHLDDIEIPRKFLEDGTLSGNDVVRARHATSSTGQPIRVVLDRLGIISQTDWARTVAEEHGLPMVVWDDFPERLPQDERLSLDYMKQNSVALLEVNDEGVRVALANPKARQIVQALRMIFGGNLELAVATDRDIEAALDRSAALAEEETTEVSDAQALIDLGDDVSDTDRLMELANNAPTVKYIETLFAKAVEAGATDIHVEALEKGPRVRLRIDGQLVETTAVERHLYDGVVSRLKILAGMDISERRLPQDGRIRQKAAGRAIDIRVASIPAVHGEALVLRLLDNSQERAALDGLSMPKRALDKLQSALHQPNGLILVTGPTGSGKTTTLHAALAEINDTGRKIITIENPVEIQTPGLIQIDINPELGWTFASALRSVLRHDPDVLMVGEIRDAETAELAVRAALTGHLVLSTLHANTASEAALRMRDMGVQDYLLKSVLRLAGAQRLVRTLCETCKEPLNIDDEPSYSVLFESFVNADPSLGHPAAWTPHEAVGCSKCNQTGYAGRMAVFEMLDDPASLAGERTQGRRSMGNEGIMLFAQGRTTLNELVNVFGAGDFWT